MKARTIKLTTMRSPNTESISYVIRELDRIGSMGSVWKQLEKGTKEEMISSFDSDKYSDCRKINEL